MKMIITRANKLRTFFGEVKLELKKCSWLDKPELMESTVVVIISCVILAAFVGLSDTVLMYVLRMIIR